jgi:hypothetical protein
MALPRQFGSRLDWPLTYGCSPDYATGQQGASARFRFEYIHSVHSVVSQERRLTVGGVKKQLESELETLRSRVAKLEGWQASPVRFSMEGTPVLLRTDVSDDVALPEVRAALAKLADLGTTRVNLLDLVLTLNLPAAQIERLMDQLGAEGVSPT